MTFKAIGSRWLLRVVVAAAVVAVPLLGPAAARAGGAPALAWSLSTGGGSIVTYDYGTVVVGDSATRTFKLTNSGGSATAALTVGFAAVSGSPATFTKTADGCSGTSLGPGKSCTVTVRYRPAVPGGIDSVGLTAKGKKPAASASVILTGNSDPTPPETTITSNPSNPTSASSAGFDFTGTDSSGTGVAGFECDLDAGGFAACTSAKSYTGLADGSHTFQVRAIDNVGNIDPSPASFTWIVDTTAPDTAIDNNPSNPSSSDAAGFTFNGTDSGTWVAGFECDLDGGGFAACTSPKSYTGLADGSHTFQVRAIDNAGNIDPSPATFTWIVDTTVIITAIAAGIHHTCALTSEGAVKCWGNNEDGQLGDGTTTDSSTPVDVTGLASGVTAIAAGFYHSCAVTSEGGVKCWGRNAGGALGDGTTTDSSTPVDVAGLASGVTAIAAGRAHTCAVTSGGAAKCWGAGSGGQLGDGTMTNSSTPVDVTGLTSGVSAIAGGSYHSCAVTGGGAVKCWGLNIFGQLGDGTTTESSTPVDVAGLASGAAAIAAGGFHTCALTSGGAAKCWGNNDFGQLGNGTTFNSSTPVDVTGVASGATAITTGSGNHSCAVTSGGAAKCWGNNDEGDLGDGTTTDSSTPVDVIGLASGVIAIAAGGFHSCAATSQGGVKCWGLNGSGQVGDGTTTKRLTPVDVLGL